MGLERWEAAGEEATTGVDEMEVARKRNGRNGRRNSGNGKGSMLESSSLQARDGSSGVDSPLATQLQQAWLHTAKDPLQRNVARSNFHSAFPSPSPFPEYRFRGGSPDSFDPQQQYAAALSRSSSFSQYSPKSILSRTPSHVHIYFPYHGSSGTYSCSEAGSAATSRGQDELGGMDSDPMEDDIMLQYFTGMMDEEMADQKSMHAECSAQQAMPQELTDLIADGSHTDENYVYGEPECDVPTTGKHEEAEKDIAVNSWIDEVLNSNPHDFCTEEEPGESGHDVGADLADEVSSIAAGITNITTGSPKSRSTGSTSQEATPAALTEKRDIDVYDCINLEIDWPKNAIVDYSNGRSGLESMVDLYPLLMQCAQAVATDNVGEADRLISHLWLKTSPAGDAGQRLAYYIVEALVARLSGTGAPLCTALTTSRPLAAEMLKAYRMFGQCNPLPRISHFFANATIMTAAQGSDRIHIIDYGILYGIQWPSFLKSLSVREGGPPHVRITGIDFTQPGFQRNDRVEDTGRRLQARAKELGVELEFHAIAGKWENITAAQLQLKDDETLIVNCMFRLRHLLDETVLASSPRKMVLSRIHSLNPKVFVMGVISAGYNSPFFMARVRETINYFSSVLDVMHSTMPPDSEWRQLVEKEIIGREILNVIACEGIERIERAETYRQWQSRSLTAGFRQLPLDYAITARIHDFLKNFNSHFGVALDGNWILSGWRDRVIFSHTAWTCA